MKQKEEIQNFWEQKEKENNSKLVIATACEYLRGYNNVDSPIYGLLYLMENGFYFENFEEKNFMKNIFLGNKKFEKLNFSINLDEVEEVKTINGIRKKSELKFIHKIVRFFGFTSNILKIKLKNNKEYYFKCIEPVLNICEKYYQLK